MALRRWYFYFLIYCYCLTSWNEFRWSYCKWCRISRLSSVFQSISCSNSNSRSTFSISNWNVSWLQLRIKSVKIDLHRRFTSIIIFCDCLIWIFFLSVFPYFFLSLFNSINPSWVFGIHSVPIRILRTYISICSFSWSWALMFFHMFCLVLVLSSFFPALPIGSFRKSRWNSGRMGRFTCHFTINLVFTSISPHFLARLT